MPPPRPNLLDLRSDSQVSSTSSKSMRSPRLHIAGEAPPELSPLDAFALQSRMLARQLQDTTKDGNRVSRLPPLTVESPLIQQGRSDYFRSLSADEESEANESPMLQQTSPKGLGMRMEVKDAFEKEYRPVSMHPRMSTIPPTPDAEVPTNSQAFFRETRKSGELTQICEDHNFLGFDRRRSPSPIQSDTQSYRSSPFRPTSNRSGHMHSPQDFGTNSPEKLKAGSFEEAGLAPPRPSFTKRTSSVTSSPRSHPADDDSVGNLSGSYHSLPPRKFSSSSAAFSQPMMSPSLQSLKRSPSVSSDASGFPRPSFNFSRPLSRSGTPTFDYPSRQASSDSHPSFMLADESVHTPMSMHSEAFLEQQALENGASPAASYTYSKFSLPRGKTVQRSEDPAPGTTASFQWEQPIVPPSNVQRLPQERPPSPPTRPVSAYARSAPDPDAISMMSSMPRPSAEAGKMSLDIQRNHQPTAQLSTSSPQRSQEFHRSSDDTARGRDRGRERERGRSPPSTNTSDTASTIRPPPTSQSVLTASEMSAEDHLNKGIQCHENGSVNESTYHLRHAARQGNPTGMLLYALACRHGWGMRANQREGVQWLRKAAEHASLEIADDEDQVKEGKQVDHLESKTRKAQFALSIYELGVSHMNGWGIEQDKTLALRCFEIAGSKYPNRFKLQHISTTNTYQYTAWGDVDALAEAGFCYAQGVGTKKDLKKSAKFYRMAEAKGMSMVGNSWYVIHVLDYIIDDDRTNHCFRIHKSKYADDSEKSNKKDKKKGRSKSRTRTMFGLRSGH